MNIPLQIKHHCNSALLLSDNLVTATETGNNRLRLKPETVDLGKWLSKVIDHSKLLFENSERQLRLTITPPSPLARIDTLRMEQLVGNLLSNALKYGGPKTPVDIDLCVDGDVITLSFRDYGQGIPEHIKNSLFEPLAASDVSTSGKVRSTGLGLYISRAIAVAHNGDLRADSESGQGTIFRLTLPR